MGGYVDVLQIAGVALQAAALAVSLGMAAVLYRGLPGQIPIQFDVRGRASQTGGRWWFLVLSGICASIVLLDWAALLFPQSRHLNAPSEAVAQVVGGVTVAFVPVIQYYMAEVAHGRLTGIPPRLMWGWFGLLMALTAAAVATGFLT